MATNFTMAHAVWDEEEDRLKKLPMGIFSNRQQVYKAIGIMEGVVTDVDMPLNEVDKLVYPSVILRMKSGEQPTSYRRMCGMLREFERVALYDDDGDVKYLVWAFEVNVMPNIFTDQELVDPDERTLR